MSYVVLPAPALTKDSGVLDFGTQADGARTVVAHGLGEEPKTIEVWIECIIADQGYSVGDKIFLGKANASTASALWNTFSFDATNIIARSQGTASILTGGLNESTSSLVTLDRANWEVKARAFA